ncbi:CPBP family intramembrane glutamic endopeptidase [Streptococcus periodonticum]|uniref:CPBP family intramembrane glutamic endopeptidase n=1 Tax=Streptococcus periodonticum TaxID=2490633 RepID=UPI00157FB355|nr:CPBP family intramembrane glutamic endopeptidase [Streptococcus periodonticum]
MKTKYLKSLIFPLTIEMLFILGCFLCSPKDHIFLNFLFYLILAIYFSWNKDFSLKEWWKAVRSGGRFWKQVLLTILFLSLAFVFTNFLESLFPDLDKGMIHLRADCWLKLVLYAASTILLPPIAEEIFYRKLLISFKSKKILIATTVLSMFLFALEHAFAIWGIFLCMIWGLPLSLSYIRTRNLYVPMTAHLICNIIINGLTVFEVCNFLLS